MKPSEVAHAEREREGVPAQNNKKIKSEQLILNKTYMSKWPTIVDS
jgi:hypothetical protein